MTDFATARISDIEEVTDGRAPWRRVRLEFGIESFGINAWTAHEVGDRIINEHDEADGYGSEEELYLVQSGRATFLSWTASASRPRPGRSSSRAAR